MLDQLHQQKLSFHSSGRVETKRPGPALKPQTATLPTLLHSQRRRRKVGGINEIDVIQAFQQSCAHRDVGEPNSNVSTLNDDNSP
jgi:hypothetical protein